MSYILQSEIIKFDSLKSLTLPLNKKVWIGSKWNYHLVAVQRISQHARA